MSDRADTPRRAAERWYHRPDPTGQTSTGEVGLRFECTQCGNCCTGAPGYVLFTDDEAKAMAEQLGVDRPTFEREYTHRTLRGRSLREVETEHGHDCVLLDRQTQPGKALCRVYRARPAQCRTWPFWNDNIRSRRSWERASRTCPGMNTGQLHEPRFIELRLAEDVEASRE